VAEKIYATGSLTRSRLPLPLDERENPLYAVSNMIEARGEKKRVALTVDLVDTLSRGIYTTPV